MLAACGCCKVVPAMALQQLLPTTTSTPRRRSCAKTPLRRRERQGREDSPLRPLQVSTVYGGAEVAASAADPSGGLYAARS
jgi:hypothetical protein